MSFRPGLPSATSLALLAIALLALYLTDGSVPGLSDDGRGEPQGKRVAAQVTRVVDGDTAEMELMGTGETEDVRYIGIDTPESVDPDEPVECFGKEASRFNERLVEGRRVELRFGAERRDRYGRLLAYIYLGNRFVNEILVRRGFARTLEFPPNTDKAGLLAKAEQTAAADGRGLWGAC